MTTAPALLVARIDPDTGLPSRLGEMTGFADLAEARVRAETLTNLSARSGRNHHYAIWRLDREFQAEVTFATTPSPLTQTEQV